jgi:S-adenosylmethionine-diacylglycerol 3-amino-3-carboxypropyl transferase
MYAGTFAPGHRYDWLQSADPIRAEVLWHHGTMMGVLSDLPPASADMVHISNILDWLSPSLAAQTLEAAARVLKPGGKLIARQLNSSLDFEALTDVIAWDADWGRRMEPRDRSFFYPRIFVGTRP